ncbi:Hypothetical protein CpCAPJ4_01725 [Corynebacterium pseudotuberculosis]|nr:hypothetical protein CpPA04_0910 [Corynebacterium pseudotuberculosis]ATQ65233.1 Hypothetical protein CpPA07_0926 [Corynebacterium pseudotuberculosis]AUY58989.1 Hypothetical protein CpCAPJ4_01725 [Corynebacterium pseudotuberculosis]
MLTVVKIVANHKKKVHRAQDDACTIKIGLHDSTLRAEDKTYFYFIAALCIQG